MRRTPQSSGGSHQPYEEAPGFFSTDATDDVASVEVEATIGDLERALCRDRSHAVVAIPPGSRGTLLLRVLEKRLAGSLPVVQVAAPAAGHGEICARILAELRQEPGHDAEERLLGFVRELAKRGSALVLLIGGAGGMQAQTLGCFGRLAAASKSGLRLVLVVEVEPRSEGNAIAELVAALGVGAEKVVLRTRVERDEAEACEAAPRVPSELPGNRIPQATEPAPGPPGLEEGGSQPRSLAEGIRAAGLLRHVSQARRWPLFATAAVGIALALLGAQLRSAPTLPREALPEPVRSAEPGEPVRPPVPAAVRPVPSRAEAEPAGPGDDPPRSPGGAGSEAGARPTAKRSAKPTAAVRTIPVSLNAQPWARIEVDGREVGITPLADLPMAPGLHRFRAHLADGRVVERTMEIDAYRNHISFP